MINKKYIVYDDYKIGYIREICTCDKCEKRGKAEVFINDLNDDYLDCIKASSFDEIIYLGDSLSDAIYAIKSSYKRRVEDLEKDKRNLEQLVDMYSRLQSGGKTNE